MTSIFTGNIYSVYSFITSHIPTIYLHIPNPYIYLNTRSVYLLVSILCLGGASGRLPQHFTTKMTLSSLTPAISIQ